MTRRAFAFAALAKVKGINRLPRCGRRVIGKSCVLSGSVSWHTRSSG